jgi:hypothetical protein
VDITAILVAVRESKHLLCAGFVEVGLVCWFCLALYLLGLLVGFSDLIDHI